MTSRYKRYSDAQLTELIQRQDTYAFEELYDRYWAMLFSFARNVLADDDEAEDVVQETFISLYQKSPTLTNDYPITAYLYRLVRNSLINVNKRQKIKATVLASFIEYYEKGVWETDERVREKELAAQIQMEIEKLPPQMRRIFEMSRRQYLSRKQIADELGISEKTVKKTIQVALGRLRGRLGCILLLSIMQFILWLNRTF